jgi:hypothetical protein
VVTHSSKKLMNFFIIGLLFLSGAERSKDIHPHQGLSLYGEDANK